LVGCDKNEDAADGQAAQQQMPPAVVNVQTVTLETVPQVQTFAGRTAAYQTADVRPQVNGMSLTRYCSAKAATSKKTNHLYRINTDNYATSVTSGQAAMSTSTSQLSDGVSK
jgi:membrane fusion protein (multidrug efflux system)